MPIKEHSSRNHHECFSAASEYVVTGSHPALPNPYATQPSLLQPCRWVSAFIPGAVIFPQSAQQQQQQIPAAASIIPAPPATAVSPIPPPPPHTFSAVDQSKFSPTPAMVEALAALSHDPALLRLPVTLTILLIGSISIVLWRSLESLPREHFSSPFTTISLLMS